MILCLIRRLLGTFKIIASHQYGYMRCIFCKKYTLFCRSKSTAYDKYFFTGKELPITGGTVSHAMTFKLFLAFESYHPGMRSGGNNDTEALKCTCTSHNLFDITVYINISNFGRLKFRSKTFRLFSHPLGELFSTGLFDTRIIHHL